MNSSEKTAIVMESGIQCMYMEKEDVVINFSFLHIHRMRETKVITRN